MKTFLLALALLTLPLTAHAQEDVQGYVRSDGRFVMPSWRRDPQEYYQAPPVAPPNVPNPDVDFIPQGTIQQQPGIGIPPPPAAVW
jgi:hypothetical protein